MLKEKATKGYFRCQVCNGKIKDMPHTNWFKLEYFDKEDHVPAKRIRGSHNFEFAFCEPCWKKLAGKQWTEIDESQDENDS